MSCARRCVPFLEGLKEQPQVPQPFAHKLFASSKSSSGLTDSALPLTVPRPQPPPVPWSLEFWPSTPCTHPCSWADPEGQDGSPALCPAVCSGRPGLPPPRDPLLPSHETFELPSCSAPPCPVGPPVGPSRAGQRGPPALRALVPSDAVGRAGPPGPRAGAGVDWLLVAARLCGDCLMEGLTPARGLQTLGVSRQGCSVRADQVFQVRVLRERLSKHGS